METLKKWLAKINSNLFVKNLILAVCAVIVFIFIAVIFLNLVTRHNSSREVPDFKGMPLEQVVSYAKKMSLKIEVNDSLYAPEHEGGMVLDQSPNPGMKVKPGRRIFLTVNSFQQKNVKIPYVTGFSLRQAKNVLEVAGLEIEKLVYQPDIATNNVLKETFNGKTIDRYTKLEAQVGSGITLTVGKAANARPQAVPKVVGFPIKEAKSRLWEAGFNVKFEMDEGINLLSQNDARVYIQSPEQGTRSQLGTLVSIKLTLDEDKIERGSLKSDRQAKSIISSNSDEDDKEVLEREGESTN